jgi:peptidoglycan/xylan/chitin deacetylase (PgdA/CDA1 family)
MLPPLPPLPAPPLAVSAETRLAYVLKHFWLAYPGSPVVSVGYKGIQPRVEIAEMSGTFFNENEPYPPAPNWREWQGQQVPFFFDSSPKEPLLLLSENKAIISADIISAAFYLLSGWQEYFSSERDRHGRFPYAASVQQKYDFVALPVVNYYFDVLRAAAEHVSGQPLLPRRWGSQKADFAAFISHDIDNLRSAWKAPAKTAMQQRKFGLFGQSLWQHLTQPDAWNNLEAVAAEVAQYGAKSTFFILPSHQPAANGTPNADYALTENLVNRLRKLFGQGYHLGLHVPIGEAASAAALTQKLRAGLGYGLAYTAGGVRFHYLCWEPRQTPAVLDKTDVAFDSTLGFAEHFGFRHSYCHPFFPFNFATGQEVDFWEFPLTVMDTTLRHPAYLQLAPEAVLPALRPVFEEVKKFGGLLSLLWHNENFDPANHYNGPRQFHEIMAYLQQQGAAFPTGVAVVESYW